VALASGRGRGSRPAGAAAARREGGRQIYAQIGKQGFGPETLITDKLRSYGAAKTQLVLSARHEQGLGKNNRAQNSHVPGRRRVRKMQRFKSPGLAQRLPSMHSAVHNTFNLQRHLVSRDTLRALGGEAFENWQTATAA
jgi:transposase-like protein